MNIKPNLVYQLAVSFLYSLAPVVVFPYVSRVLGPEAIGKINFVDYTAQFFLLFASFGIPLYGAREVARRQRSREAVQGLVSDLLLIHLVITLCSSTLFLGLVLWQRPSFGDTYLVILAAINILIGGFSLDWLVQGLEDFPFLSKRSYVIKLATVVAIFLLVQDAEDYLIYYLVLILSSALLMATDIYYYRRRFSFRPERKWRQHLKPLFLFFLTSSAISLYSYFDTLLLGLLSGTLAVGFYTTGLKTVKLSQSLVNDLGGVLLPRMAFLFEQGDHEEIHRILNRSLQYILTLSLPLSLGLWLLAPELVAVLAGSAFSPSVFVLQLLSPLPLLIGLSNLFGIQILLPFRKEKAVLVIVLAGSSVSILSNILLCPLLNEKGAAISCLLAEGSVTMLMALQARKLTQLVVPIRLLLQTLCSILLFIPVVLIVRGKVTHALSILLISGLVCGLLYSYIQYAFFKNPVLEAILRFLKLPTRTTNR